MKLRGGFKYFLDPHKGPNSHSLRCVCMEREVARLVKLLEQERKEKEEEAEVFHKKVNQAGF